MKRPVLFINACVRNGSRTKRLADAILSRLGKPVEEVCLHETQFPIVDEAFLNQRDRLISEGAFNVPVFDLARRFAKAETVVIAAPYWDLSFPAALRQYFEQINVLGITFRYTEDGVPVGLCKANQLIFVTTAGGYYAPEEFGFGYIKALAQNYYGISDVRLVKAVGLDLQNADVEAIMRSAEKTIADMILDQ